jgi:hypothetical protein
MMATVRFLRMLSNSVIAGMLMSGYLAILFLHLNPSFPLIPSAVLPLLLVMAIAYGLNLSVAFYALIVVRQLIGSEVLSPGWLSVRLLSWFCTIAAAAASVLMWLNLRGFAPVLRPETTTRMSAGAITMSASAVVFLLIAFAHIGRRGGRMSAVVLTAMMAISLAAPLAARGRSMAPAVASSSGVSPLALATAPAPGRVFVLAFDGATLDIISPAVAEGRLPNLARIFDGGAVLHLATLRPTQAEPVWSAIMTGRLPDGNGVRASALYRVHESDPGIELLPDYCFAQALVRYGFLIEEPHQSSALRARPLWRILNDSALSVGVIGLPLTHPAPEVHGYLVSDEFHRLSDTVRTLDEGTAVSPAEALLVVRDALDEPPLPDPQAVLVAAPDRPQGADLRPDPAPIAGDRMHLQIMRRMQALLEVQFIAARFPGVDAVGHSYLRYADPSAFGDVSAEQLRQYGRVLPDYYGFVDAVVGFAVESLKPDDLLLVISGFGMEPLSLGKRVLEQLFGDARISGSHERAPDGFLLAYGTAVSPGRPPRASLVDVTPTILYYLGLPVGRDMDGFARTDLFRPAFTASRPVTFIPTYGR